MPIQNIIRIFDLFGFFNAGVDHSTQPTISEHPERSDRFEINTNRSDYLHSISSRLVLSIMGRFWPLAIGLSCSNREDEQDNLMERSLRESLFSFFQYHDRNADGVINGYENELRGQGEGYGRYLPQQDVYNLYDLNQDGMIDEMEAWAAMHRTGLYFSERRMNAYRHVIEENRGAAELIQQRLREVLENQHLQAQGRVERVATDQLALGIENYHDGLIEDAIGNFEHCRASDEPFLQTISGVIARAEESEWHRIFHMCYENVNHADGLEHVFLKRVLIAMANQDSHELRESEQNEMAQYVEQQTLYAMQNDREWLEEMLGCLITLHATTSLERILRSSCATDEDRIRIITGVDSPDDFSQYFTDVLQDENASDELTQTVVRRCLGDHPDVSTVLSLLRDKQRDAVRRAVLGELPVSYNFRLMHRLSELVENNELRSDALMTWHQLLNQADEQGPLLMAGVFNSDLSETLKIETIDHLRSDSPDMLVEGALEFIRSIRGRARQQTYFNRLIERVGSLHPAMIRDDLERRCGLRRVNVQGIYLAGRIPPSAYLGRWFVSADSKDFGGDGPAFHSPSTISLDVQTDGRRLRGFYFHVGYRYSAYTNFLSARFVVSMPGCGSRGGVFREDGSTNVFIPCHQIPRRLRLEV